MQFNVSKRPRAFLVNRFWVLERSVDVHGADYLVQRRLLGQSLLDIHRLLEVADLQSVTVSIEGARVGKTPQVDLYPGNATAQAMHHTAQFGLIFEFLIKPLILEQMREQVPLTRRAIEAALRSSRPRQPGDSLFP